MPLARGPVKNARRPPARGSRAVVDREHGGGTLIRVPMVDMSIRSKRMLYLRN